MKIETKYNIGQDVCVANVFREPIEVKIYGIVAEVKDENVIIYYLVGIDRNGCTLRKEELVYTTKEELLNSL